jgi:hypothetical protein
MIRLLALALAVCATGCAYMRELGIDFSKPTDAESNAEEQAPVREALSKYLRIKALLPDTSKIPLPYVAVMPFRNESSFRKGVWDLESEMARVLSERMDNSPDWHVVPWRVVDELTSGPEKLTDATAVAVGVSVEADIVLIGRILEYDMSRVTVGDPMVGGYKSYSGIAEIEMRALRVLDGTVLGTVAANEESVDRGLGLNLLGRPRDQDRQFMSLHKMVFGSEEFSTTAIGQVTDTAMQLIIQQFTEVIRPSSLKMDGQPGEILSVHEDEVYINIGSENKLRVAYRFKVYAGPDRAKKENLNTQQHIAIVEVQEIIGARLASVRVLDGEGKIQPGDRLRLMGAEDQ